MNYRTGQVFRIKKDLVTGNYKFIKDTGTICIGMKGIDVNKKVYLFDDTYSLGEKWFTVEEINEYLELIA